MKVHLSKFWDTRGLPQLILWVPASVQLIHGNPLGNLRTTNALTSWSWLDTYIIKTRFCQVIWGVSMSLDDSVMQYNVRTTGLRLVTFWSHWREDVIHAPVESQAGWTCNWTTRSGIGGNPALPSLGITSEPVSLDKNGWYWKPSQLLGASEVTDLRKEATITTLLDEHVLAHPKSWPMDKCSSQPSSKKLFSTANGNHDRKITQDMMI